MRSESAKESYVQTPCGRLATGRSMDAQVYNDDIGTMKVEELV